jgi:methionyl aminopeptidase
MAIRLKTQAQIERMRATGRLVYQALQRARRSARVGMTTAELAEEAELVLIRGGAEPLFRGYTNLKSGGSPFPAGACVSVNEALVHGVPSDRPLQAGDLVSLDVGARLNGWCADSAISFVLEPCQDERRRGLCRNTRRMLELGIRGIRPGLMWSRIARRMQEHAQRLGLDVIREYVGHGIGRTMHESEPQVPNYAPTENPQQDFRLVEGLVIAIEPMLNLGMPKARVLPDGWTVVTADGSLAAHCEHTVAVTPSGADVLTDGR